MTRVGAITESPVRTRVGAILTSLIAAGIIVAACGGDDEGRDKTVLPEAAPTSPAAPASPTAPPAPAAPANGGDDTPEPAPAPVEPAPVAPAPEPPPPEAPADGDAQPERDAGAAPLPYDNDHALNVLRTLSVEIGPRVQATAGERAAADFLEEAFSSFGYRVERQEFSIPTFSVSRLVVTADGEPLDAAAFAFSAGGTAEGPLVAVPGFGTPADFDQVDVSGAIALIERGVLFFQDKVNNAEAAGAVGVIIFNNDAGVAQGGLGDGSNVPTVGIRRADGLALSEAAQAGEVVASIALEGGATIAQSENVIARAPDSQCLVYVGGHYDSVPGVPGANDNASGTALVVELARAFAESAGVELICFAAFGAEEAVNGSSGIAGSRALVQELEASGAADAVIAMLNLDVAGAGNALALVGTRDLVQLSEMIATALGIDAGGGRLPAGAGSDHLNFQAVGIPVIFPTVVGAPIHIPSDNFGAIDSDVLEQTGRLAHATLACLVVLAGGALDPPPGCDVEARAP